MQRGGFVAYRSSGEGTLIGAVSALLILAAVALLTFEVAGLQDRGGEGEIAVIATALANDTDAAGLPAYEVEDLTGRRLRLP